MLPDLHTRGDVGITVRCACLRRRQVLVRFSIDAIDCLTLLHSPIYPIELVVVLTETLMLPCGNVCMVALWANSKNNGPRRHQRSGFVGVLLLEASC